MEQIGKYKVIRKLGSGGFGAVYLGEDQRLGERVAIKVFQIRDENLANQVTTATGDAGDVLKQRFLNEARTLRKLSRNPYIIEMYDFDELADGTPYYVMPFLPHSLKDELGSDATDAAVVAELPTEEKPRRLPLTQSLLYIEQLLVALKDVHQSGLVHRDIKPANVLLNEQDQVRLCDFGIAKIPDSEHSHSGIGMGSRNYMAPEQRQSAKHVDSRSDIFSVGVLAYRMLTGTLPEGRYADPKIYQPGISDDLNAFILKALEQDKDKRFHHAGEMLATLKSLQSSSTPTVEDENTSTWVGDDSPFKAELKPLQTKIEQLLKIQGEVLPADLPILQALADVIDLDESELQALIQQTEKALAANDPQQKAFQQWVNKLNMRHQQQHSLTQSERATLVDAAALLTGRDKDQLIALLAHKFPLKNQANTNSSETSGASKAVDNQKKADTEYASRQKSSARNGTKNSEKERIKTAVKEHPLRFSFIRVAWYWPLLFFLIPTGLGFAGYQLFYSPEFNIDMYRKNIIWRECVFFVTLFLIFIFLRKQAKHIKNR